MGAYLSVMQVLGIERDLERLAAADPLGRELQDSRLRPHKRPAGTLPATPAAPPRKPRPRAAPLVKLEKRASLPRGGGWAQQSGFASSTALASLIETGTTSAKKRR
jgi:hypothetical protein